MRGTGHGIAGMLSLAVITLSLILSANVDAQTAYHSAMAANSTVVAASVKAGTGGSAPWGLLLAIVGALAIFVVGGIFVAMRARREYLDEQRRNAAMPKDDT